MKLVLCYPVEPQHLAQIRRTVPEFDVVDVGQEHIAEQLLDADLFCGHAKVPVPWDTVVTQGRLRWIQSSAAGLDHCLVPAVIHSDIIVTSASGVLSDQVAEHTVALLTATLRSLPVFLEAQSRHEFIRRPTRDLHHCTIGIAGFGGVGRRVAEVLAPYKTRLLAVDIVPVDKPDTVEHLWPADQLDRMLGECDIVILCLPLTEITRGQFDRDRLARMKPGAILINVARGPLVVEEALVEALESGALSAAAMDVTEVEPLPAASRLWDMPNVLITPHVAGQSARRIDDMTDFLCDNLLRFRKGQPLRNLVDKQRGYPIRQAIPSA